MSILNTVLTISLSTAKHKAQSFAEHALLLYWDADNIYHKEKALQTLRELREALNKAEADILEMNDD